MLPKILKSNSKVQKKIVLGGRVFSSLIILLMRRTAFLEIKSTSLKLLFLHVKPKTQTSALPGKNLNYTTIVIIL